ncbi:MAG: alpha-glucosidase [Robiginitomaculum sp.]|nr:MAG: alpha-glucosidase [Robiginitomaculum sp.]
MFSLGLFLILAGSVAAKEVALKSPDGKIVLRVDVERGVPRYAVAYGDKAVVMSSRLGMRFKTATPLDEGLRLGKVERASLDRRWEQPWGERRQMREHYNEVLVHFLEQAPKGKVTNGFAVRFRVFNDGVGFRYEIPPQSGQVHLEIVDELTEFAMDPASTAWWIPARGWNRYEYLYKATPLSEVGRANTPITLKTPDGIYLSLHEAALVDYSGMSLDQKRSGLLKADLAPWSDGVLVKADAPFNTPWRTIQIAPDSVGLINSDLILNLNEPNKLGDVSWVEKGKYVGIWWGMHIKTYTWGSGPKHGATTKNAKYYIDFAAKNGFSGVLIEGWNIGWDGDWFHNGALFSFTQPYPDFDLKEITDYARAHGVRLIGHHETSGDVSNYEAQMEDAFALYEKRGVRIVKTGYVADGGGIQRVDENGTRRYEWHDGQFTVNHHLRVVKAAARHHISINAHEPVKDTGLRRTYPNWISREGARGQEYNAWGVPPNSPEHTAILPFTRMLAGPMDFTPGIFDLDFGHGLDAPTRVQTTLAKQLALYVVLYSPIQMVADLPKNYEKRPKAFQFIKDVPTDWEDSIALAGEIGDYVAIARKVRGGADWYIGALSDEKARTIVLPMDFLTANERYVAQIYRDGPKADWKTNPYAMVIEEKPIARGEALRLWLAPGGGVAIRIHAMGRK